MTTRTHLNAITDGKKVDLPLVGQLFLKFNNSSAEISENGGPVLIYEQDGVVTVKVETDDAKGLIFNDHEVKKGGIYFFEIGDILKYKSTVITLSEVEIIKSSFTKTQDDFDFDFDKDNEETKIVIQENLDMTTLLNDPSKASLIQSNKKPEENQEKQKKKESTLKFELSKPNEKKDQTIKEDSNESKREFTRTSIDIQQLLKSSKMGQEEHEEQEVVPRDKTKSKITLLEKSRDKKEKVKEKSSNKIDLSNVKKQRKINAYDSIRICGPFTRFFAFLTSITISFSLYQFLNFEVLNNHVVEFTDLLFNKIPQLQDFIQYKIQANGLIKFLVIYSSIELISALVLATSIPLFLVGVTTSGNFVTKRVKAFFRFPLDILSTFIFIFELPILFGKRTLKETLTISKIGYRSVIFKIFALPLLISLLILSVFYTFLLDFKGEVHPKEIFSSSLFRESSAINYSNISFSKNIENSFEIIGWQKPTINYLLVKKDSAATVMLREYNSLSFRKFEKLQQSVALFSVFYTNLDKYLNNEAHDIDEVRKDVVKLIRSGEFQLLQNHENIEALNILSTNQMTQFIRDNQMNFDKVITTGDYTRIYEFKNEFKLVFIGKDSIKLIAVDSSLENTSAYLQQITLNTKTTNPSSLDQIYNTPDQSVEFVDSAKQKLNSIMDLIRTKNPAASPVFGRLTKELQSFEAYGRSPEFKSLVDSVL